MGLFKMSITTIFCVIAVLFQLVSISLAARKDCGPGTFFSGDACKKCKPGTFQNKKGSLSCTSCSIGTYNPFHGAQGTDVCIECKEGTFSNITGATSKSACKKCPKGTNSPAGSPECGSCPKGKYLSLCDPFLGDFSTAYLGMCFHCFLCASCGGGLENCPTRRPLQLKCYDCFSGSYNDKPNALECKLCPLEKTAVQGSSECRHCPPGRGNVGDGRCAECKGFSYNDGTFEDCENCPPGYTANTRNGGSKCVPCPAGTYKGEDKFDGNNSCRLCKPGENSFVTGATFCVPDNTPCPPSFFRNNRGACLHCSEKQRFDAKKKECIDCRKNYISEGGLATKCTRCPKGSVTSDYENDPLCICEPGWGQDLTSDTMKCKKCAPGSVSPSSNFCFECSAGWYAPKAGMKDCLQCPSGTKQPFRGQTKCVPLSCPKGTIVRDSECIDPPTNCPPNHDRIEDSFGLDKCNAITCPVGLVLAKTYFGEPTKECIECEKDERYDPEKNKCLKCRRTEVSAGRLQQVCTKCEGGREAFEGACRCPRGRIIVKGKCVKCPKGTFTNDSHFGECKPCPAGSFGQEGGYCSTCPAGTFSGPRATSCTSCPKGMISFGMGDAGCVRVGSLGK